MAGSTLRKNKMPNSSGSLSPVATQLATAVANKEAYS